MTKWNYSHFLLYFFLDLLGCSSFCCSRCIHHIQICVSSRDIRIAENSQLMLWYKIKTKLKKKNCDGKKIEIKTYERFHLITWNWRFDIWDVTVIRELKLTNFCDSLLSSFANTFHTVECRVYGSICDKRCDISTHYCLDFVEKNLLTTTAGWNPVFKLIPISFCTFCTFIWKLTLQFTKWALLSLYIYIRISIGENDFSHLVYFYKQISP